MNHPQFVQPMKAVADGLPTGADWSYELKWDGMRIQASILKQHVGSALARLEPQENKPETRANVDQSLLHKNQLLRENLLLRSSSGRDVTDNFPELWSIGDNLDLDAVIDGELVVFDGERPSFSRLQRRIHTSNPSPVLQQSHPVVFVAFDLLRLDDKDMTSLAYLDRRRMLRRVVQDGATLRVPPHSQGSGTDLLAFARSRSLEGIVAKRSHGTYQPGNRSHEWLKIKLRRRQEFVVGGWLEGSGALEGTIGSLLLGTNEHSGFVFAGAVGSGLSDNERDALRSLLRPTNSSAFTNTPNVTKTPHWVDPVVVVEVGYAEWEPGHHLRHPTYEGRRPDKMASEVIRDRVEPLE